MKIQIPKRLPRLVEPQRYGLNGRLPNPRAFQRVATAANHIAARRGKLLFVKSAQLAHVHLGVAGTNTTWMWKSRTGAAARSVTFMVGLGTNATTILPPPDPRCYFSLDDGVSVVNTEQLRHAKRASESLPSTGIDITNISHLRIEQPVSPDTEYAFSLILEEYARVVYLCAYETPSDVRDTGHMIVDPAPFLAENPIYDMGPLVRQVNGLRQTQGQPVFNWCREFDDATSPTTSSSILTNILDGSTELSDTSAGHRFSLRHRGRPDGMVPLVVSAHGVNTQEISDVKVLFDDGTEAQLGFGTVEGWADTAVLVPDTVTKADIQFAVNNIVGGTLRLDAVSVYQYG